MQQAVVPDAVLTTAARRGRFSGPSGSVWKKAVVEGLSETGDTPTPSQMYISDTGQEP